MSEYAVEYGVQIQPVEIFWVVLIEPQQVAGLIKQDLTVRSQHPAALVRGGGRALSAISRKRKSRYSPLRTTASTSPPMRACHSSWVSGRWDWNGLRGSKNFSFWIVWGKSVTSLRTLSASQQTPPSHRCAMPALLEGAGARSTTEGGFYCLKIKIVPLLFGLRSILFVLRIRQQGGGRGVLCLGGKGGGGRKTALSSTSSASRARMPSRSCAFSRRASTRSVFAARNAGNAGGGFGQLPRIPQPVKAEHCHHIGIVGIVTLRENAVIFCRQEYIVEKTLPVMVSLPEKVCSRMWAGVSSMSSSRRDTTAPPAARRHRQAGTPPARLGDVVHKSKQTGGVPGAACTRMVSSAKQFKNTSLPTVRLLLPTVSRRRLRQL